MTETSPILARVGEAISRYSMFEAGIGILVAVSGGPDSIALLHILYTLSAETGWCLTVAHLNHGFRGAESDGEADYVAEFAANLGLPAVIQKIDVPALRRRRHLSSQEAARIARHDFLRRAAEECGATRIALGHTADDRVETVLLNLFRGAGPDGLAGFPAVQLPLVRPLYTIRRVETHRYCLDKALNARTDSSNSSLTYHRNRIREELLPNIRSYYNERVDEAILRMADLTAEENRMLESLAADALAQIVQREEPAVIFLSANALNALPLPLRRRTLRLAIRRIRGHLQQIPFETIERILSNAETRQQITEMLPVDSCSVSVTVSPDRVRIAIDEPQVTLLPWECHVNLPGRTAILQSHLQIQATIHPTASDALLAAQNGLEMAQQNTNSLLSALVLRELATTELPLRVRSWRSGDRFRPRGLGGEKKLQDLFTDRKIPRAVRPHVPVLVDASDQILAIGPLHAEEHTVLLSPERGKFPASLKWSGPTILLVFESERRNPEQLSEPQRIVAGDRDQNT